MSKFKCRASYWKIKIPRQLYSAPTLIVAHVRKEWRGFFLSQREQIMATPHSQAGGAHCVPLAFFKIKISKSKSWHR